MTRQESYIRLGDDYYITVDELDTVDDMERVGNIVRGITHHNACIYMIDNNERKGGLNEGF